MIRDIAAQDDAGAADAEVLTRADETIRVIGDVIEFEAPRRPLKRIWV